MLGIVAIRSDPIHILITGASSGLGAALAIAYGVPGKQLSLTGRNEQRLNAIANKCRTAGADVQTVCLDVTDRDAMASWVAEVDRKTPLDLVVASAGITSAIKPGHAIEPAEVFARIVEVNLQGVVNAVAPAVEAMAARGHGQIALISSIAGIRGYLTQPSYNASKAALNAYGATLRGALRAKGIGVTTACPGFVDTPMTESLQTSSKTMMPAEKAAQIIVSGLAKDKATIAFPKGLAFGSWLLSCLPVDMANRILSGFNVRMRGS